MVISQTFSYIDWKDLGYMNLVGDLRIDVKGSV